MIRWVLWSLAKVALYYLIILAALTWGFLWKRELFWEVLDDITEDRLFQSTWEAAWKEECV